MGGRHCLLGTSRARWPGRLLPWGWAPVTQPQPSSSQGLSQRRGSNLPTSWATTAEKPPCLAPQRLPNSCPVCVCATYVCARLCACENWVWLSAWVPCLCLIVEWSPGAVLDGSGGHGSSHRVHAWVCARESALSSPKKGCPALGSCCFLSLFFLSLTQLKQGFLVNPFSFRRPLRAPPGSTPFGLLRELWGPLKSGHNSPWREAETPEGTLAPLL